MTRYYFPFSEVKEGARVVIYGAGDVGRQYLSEIIALGKVDVLFAIDQEGYYTFKKMHSVKVYEPSYLQQINDDEYDYVVIAVATDSKAKVMKDNLISFGVPQSKIIYKLEYACDIKTFTSEGLSKWMKPSFSFFGEDIIIKNIFTMMGIETPSYLDVGCNHPYNGSNTALFYLSGSNGWNIDASQKCIDLMSVERPDDINVCCGVSTEEGTKDFYILGDTNMLNSFSEDYIKFYVETYIDKGGVSTKSEKIGCYTLRTIIDKYCDGVFPDFLDIDIEGMDEDVIASYDFSINGPKVICAETHSSAVIDQLSRQGYTFMLSTPHNSIFIRNEYAIGDACLYSEVDKALNDVDDLLEKAQTENKKIIIYGCGKVGRHVFEKLTCGTQSYAVEGFMVKDKKGNPDFWMGKPVREIGEYQNETCAVIVALVNSKCIGVEEALRSAGYENIIPLDIL